MTRIIGGIAGSLKLSPPAKVTRPTSDRIRESVFSRLDSRDAIDGLKVLDLYAGTGALGLEAASRGASVVHLVERDGKAAAVCVANLKAVQRSLANEDFNPELRVVNKAVSSFLAGCQETYDLVFIDPPYDLSDFEVTENLEGLKLLLNEGAIVVVERSSRGKLPSLPAHLELEDEKTYGDTVTYWLKKAK